MRDTSHPDKGPQAWAQVDDYLAGLLTPLDDKLQAALQRNADAGLPAIDVSAPQGQMLALLIRMTRAARVLEVGTLGGFSTIWMARALPPDGHLTSIEIDETHARVARENLRDAGLASRVELHIGAALDVLPTLRGPYDFVFIDADKPNNPHYLQWAMKLTRKGSVIVVDNVVRQGAVADPARTGPGVVGSRQCLEMMATDKRLAVTAIQTVGAKGWDGFALAIVTDD